MTEQTRLPYGLAVYAEGDDVLEKAQGLAARLKISAIQGRPEPGPLALFWDSDGLALTGNGQVLRGDFIRMLPRLKTANLQKELLVKAARLKGAPPAPTAIDATAGLGEDALLLAAAGFSVRLYERDPVIAALLANALQRAAASPALSEAAARMELTEGDSLLALQNLQSPVDVVLLDPMFPSRQKSALIKKKFQLLQQLERPCSDEEEMLAAAVAAAPRKIVIKRPLKGPYLAGRKPDYSIAGKAIRYDCIVLPRA
ncbi:MAG: class I SAM-dependent methyltransferase [Oscillospiraceae bacterium]|nr:class I SAM-dependent methyltransferase [Oscillospiraceae bacterium]